MKWLVSLLFYSLMADLCWGGQCTMANWWDSFQTRGWSLCYTSNEYMTGMWRNNNEGRHDKIYLLEEAKCCKAPAPNVNSASECTYANWWLTLDSNYRWAVCPTGYFLNGLYRSSGAWLYNIEQGKCCKPLGKPNAYGKCVHKNIGASFDYRGMSSCDHGYYMAGFYKGGCNQLYCIEKIKCCKMFKGCQSYRTLSEADRAQSYKGIVKCDSSLTKAWYRFTGSAGNKMADAVVATHHCGTHAPGYLTGGHPTVAQGVVQRKVCFHWSNNNCRWSSVIRVRNCGAFYVYELSKPPNCSLRYCGNNKQGRM